jgi:hypothetical protein
MTGFDALSLDDFPALAALADIAREFKVEIGVFGGAASRAAMYRCYQPRHEIDLFDLAPFSSDLDLIHTGDATLTPGIRALIADRVPFATWCRWAVLNRDAARRARANRDASTIVPLRRIGFGVGDPSPLPPQATNDLSDGMVTFERNPEFASSEFARANRDVEIFGLLLALNALADMRQISGRGELRDPDAARAWLDSREAREQLLRAARTAALRTRLWHMSAALIARSARNPSDLAVRFVDVLSELKLDDMLGVDLLGLLHGTRPFTVSRPTADGNFLVPELSPALSTGADARDAFERWLDRIPPEDRPVIDPAFELIGFVPDFTVLAGPPPKHREVHEADPNADEADPNADEAGKSPNDDDPFASDGEFLNVTWHGVGDAHGMTAVILPRVRQPEHDSWGGLAAGGRIGSGRWWLRTDVRGCLPNNGDGGGSIVILRVRNAKG